MKIIMMKNRELLDLFLVLIISIAFTLFSLSINFIDRIYNYFYALTSLPIAEFLINVIFLWLVGLLWITYCRWKRAVKRQKELENIISSISPDALMVVDSKRNIVMCNTSVKRMFGYEVEEVINQKTDLLYCDRRSDSSIKHEIYDALENIGFHTGLATGRKKNNDTIPLEIVTAKLRGREGVVLLLREISERAEAEKEIKEVKDHLDNIIESSLDSIVLTDNKGYVTRANKSFLELLGYTEENQVTGKHIAEFSPIEAGNYESTTGVPVDIDKGLLDSIITSMSKLTKEGKISNLEFYLIRTDKKVIPVEENIVNLYNKEGERTGTAGVIRNITERKIAEKNDREIKEFLENIFKTSADGIMVTDHEGFITMVNEAVEKMLGYSKKELIGKGQTKFRAQKKVKETQTKLLKEGVITGVERTWLKKDGNLVDVEVNAALLKDDKGNTTGSVASIRDITEHKQTNEMLRKTLAHLDNTIESSLDGIVTGDSKGNIVSTNEAFLKLTGYHKEEIKEMHIMELSITEKGTYESTTGESVEIDEEFFNDARKMTYEKLFKEGKIINWETYYLRKDRRIVPVEQNIVYLYNEEEDITGSVGIIRDITERGKAEKKIKESRNFLENIFKTSADGIMIIDHQGIITMVNEATEKILGYSKEEVIGKGAGIFTPEGEEYAATTEKYLTRLFEEGIVNVFELSWLKKDGNLIDVEVNAALIKDDKGNIISVSSIRDITERKISEKEIKEARDFLKSIIENSKDGILIVNEKGYILSCNSAMEHMSGFNREEIIGKHASTLTIEDKEMREKILEKTAELFEKGFAAYESTFKSKDGKYIDVECVSSMIKNEKGDYVAGVSILRDITERKEMEHKLIQSEKLKSLGELAGGVAHDFNNVLAVILGRAQLLKMNIEPPQGKEERRKSVIELKKGLEIIERASKDGAETVRRIQEFARRRDEDKYFTTINLNEIIENALEFTKVRWKDDAESKGIKINIQKEFSSLASISGSAAELREIFTNIINNALDAMPQGGNIKIKTFKEDSHISIKVEDTGVGIPKVMRDRIFDPFFTTKGVKSSGLGMSVSYGIINRHRGTISVDSVEGKGTTFIIKLPISEKVIETEQVKPMPEEQKKAKILVIEDEENVLDILSAILIKGGHQVETTSDGSKGIKLFEKKEFDLVFTDLGMPRMSGWQVAEKVKGINRKVPVALITGWNVELNESEMRKSGVDLLVYKPFEVNQVLKLVQEGMILRDRFKAA